MLNPPVWQIAFAAILILVGIGFVYTLSKSKKLKSLENSFKEKELEIKNLKSTEGNYKEEVLVLKNKLDRATEDPITHLLGWQLFEDRVNQMIKESARYSLVMGMLFVDIDDFKIINEALSYNVGDALLLQIAKRLEPCIRSVDSISRFAKDTFVILLSQLSKSETAALVAQRIIQSFSEPFHVKEHELYLTVGVGISIFPANAQDAAGLFRTAGQALKTAKDKGKNIYSFYQPRESDDSQRKLIIATGLKRDAIEAEFSIYYQPIIDVATNQVFCVDAILHWDHPELGWIGPNELFLYAEKLQKLNIISEWLLEKACQHFTAWRKKGFAPAMLGIPIAIKQFENTHFLYKISQILQQYEFNPKWLLLEIKENPAELSFEILEKAFNMLRYLGIQIAIDNFGSGSYSFKHLKNFPINFIKLDPTLIKDIETDPRSLALAKSLFFMGQSLSIQLIIQGLQTETEVKSLQDLGAKYMQGEYFAKPLIQKDLLQKYGKLETV